MCTWLPNGTLNYDNLRDSFGVDIQEIHTDCKLIISDGFTSTQLSYTISSSEF